MKEITGSVPPLTIDGTRLTIATYAVKEVSDFLVEVAAQQATRVLDVLVELAGLPGVEQHGVAAVCAGQGGQRRRRRPELVADA